MRSLPDSSRSPSSPLSRIAETSSWDPSRAVLRKVSGQPALRTLVPPGEPAPQLRGPTLDGDQFDLASLRGRPVVLLWWASWCLPGRELLDVVEAASRVRDDIVFVAVTWSDDPDLARQIVTDAGITIQVVDTAVIDPDPSSAWMIEGCPALFHIDEQGTVVGRLDHDDMTVEDLLNQL